MLSTIGRMDFRHNLEVGATDSADAVQPPARKGSFANALQRIAFVRPPPPVPFRDSDFEGSALGWGGVDPLPD